MTKRKPKQTLIRDERGRFAHASPEARVGLEAMRPESGYFDHGVITFTSGPRAGMSAEIGAPYCDEIYRPKKIGWIERALHWLTWNRSLSAVWFAFCNKLFP